MNRVNTQLPGCMAALRIPAACLSRKEVGGWWISISCVRSGFSFTRVGSGTPGLISAVRSLKSLQKAAMFMLR